MKETHIWITWHRIKQLLKTLEENNIKFSEFYKDLSDSILNLKNELEKKMRKFNITFVMIWLNG